MKMKTIDAVRRISVVVLLLLFVNELSAAPVAETNLCGLCASVVKRLKG